MTTPTSSRLAGLPLGRVLARSFGIWGRNFVPFTILALLIEAPLIAFALYFPVRSWGGELAFTMSILLVPFVLAMITAGALAYGVFRELGGEKATFGECLGVGLRGLFRVVGVALFVGTAFCLLFSFAMAGAGVLAYVIRRMPILALIVLFSLPAIGLVCRYWVASPSAVVEGTGVFASLKRSAALTKGSRIVIFGLIFWGTALEIGAGYLARAVVPEAPVVREQWPGDGPGAETIAARNDRQRPRVAVSLVFRAILAGLSAVAAVVVYYELRSRKEHVNVAEIAAVFG